MSQKICITESQAATAIAISKKTLQLYRRKGCGPSYSKVGKRVLYEPSQLEAWIASKRCNSTSEY